MNIKADSTAIKILEVLALVGEMSSDEICGFFNSESYVRKVLSTMRNDKIIKKSKNTEKITYRLTLAGKNKLKECFPEVFKELLSDRRSMNHVRGDKGYKDRQKNLLEMLTMFHRADIKIFPDEKVLVKNHSVNAQADDTDTTDFLKNIQPEFYTSLEIKEQIPEFNIAKGSRALGVLISYGRIYIIYSTYEGELLWWKETERKFKTTARLNLAKPLFGNNEVYMLVFADKVSTVKTIVNRYGSERCSKIHTDNTIPNLFFSLKDTTKDATLKIITQKDYYIDKLEKAMGAEMKYDKDFPCFAGKTDGDKPEYDFYAYMFDLHSVAQCIDYCKTAVPKVNFCCFDYQKEYIESITETDDNLKSRIETLTITEEGGREIVYG